MCCFNVEGSNADAEAFAADPRSANGASSIVSALLDAAAAEGVVGVKFE